MAPSRALFSSLKSWVFSLVGPVTLCPGEQLLVVKHSGFLKAIELQPAPYFIVIAAQDLQASLWFYRMSPLSLQARVLHCPGSLLSMMTHGCNGSEAAVTAGSCSLFFAGYYLLADGCRQSHLHLFEWL